ncbi:MAG: hypothetical protein ABIH20_05605 [Candidatus Diapherotrites archaeon]
MATITGFGAIVIWGLFAILGLVTVLFHKQMFYGNYSFKAWRKITGENKQMDKIYEKLFKIGGIMLILFALGMMALEIIK